MTENLLSPPPSKGREHEPDPVLATKSSQFSLLFTNSRDSTSLSAYLLLPFHPIFFQDDSPKNWSFLLSSLHLQLHPMPTKRSHSLPSAVCWMIFSLPGHRVPLPLLCDWSCPPVGSVVRCDQMLPASDRWTEVLRGGSKLEDMAAVSTHFLYSLCPDLNRVFPLGSGLEWECN